MPSPIEMMIDKACGIAPSGSGSLDALVRPARCPHCGGKAEMECALANYGKPRKEKIYHAAIYCTNRVTCGAALNVFLNKEDAARTQCVEQWNRRPNDEISSALDGASAVGGPP